MPPTATESGSSSSNPTINSVYPYSVDINPRPDPESNIVFRTIPPLICRYVIHNLSKEQYLKEFTTKVVIGSDFDYEAEINDSEFFEEVHDEVEENIQDWLLLVSKLPKLGTSRYTIIMNWLSFFKRLGTYFGFTEYFSNRDTFDCRRVDHGDSYRQCATPRTAYMIELVCSAAVVVSLFEKLIPEEVHPSEGEVTILDIWNYVASHEEWAEERALAAEQRKSAKQKKAGKPAKSKPVKKAAKSTWLFVQKPTKISKKASSTTKGKGPK
ncbi:uncharacterized protein J8A68_004559 [[Candida] subhashii]|uniref:Uncharacterized protein n=1 Tax=[Candida] subhashii TaxID=561895 RepID=A0A8J5QB04_9ASCO|nr:uncharacterized protein J8A68_004559 [[Candida] subhashii]KAG7661956.1 hypothetical protein J8A68_004559 [[Candida] subhashii]